MDCQRCERLLISYLDKGLSDRERDRVNEHLKKCSSCQKKKEEWINFISRIKEVEMESVSEERWGKCREELLSELRRKEKGISISIKEPVWRWAFSLSILLLLTFSFFSLKKRTVNLYYTQSISSSMILPSNEEELFLVVKALNEEEGELLIDYLRGGEK